MKTALIGALIFVLFYNLLFYHMSPGIGFGLFYLALHTFFYFVRNKKTQNLPLAYAASAISIIFALLIGWRGSELIQMINFATANFFAAVALFLYKKEEPFSFRLPQFLLIPLIFAHQTLQQIVQLFKFTSQPSFVLPKGPALSLLRGVAMTIPVVGVLFLLLMQADPIFGAFANRFFANIGERILVSSVLFISLLFTGLLPVLYQEKDDKQVLVREGKSHELLVLVGSTALLFAAFIAIQFRYLFSSISERDLHELGIVSLTYSEYVRRGFFELLIAATLATAVILYVLRFVHHLGKDRLVQIATVLLTLETSLLLLSAAKRVDLYQAAHGLTRARIFGFIFLLWLGIMLGILLVQLLRKMHHKWVFGSTVVATIGVIFLFNAINVDGLIATKYRPTVNNQVDYLYLASLSPDAHESWPDIIDDARQLVTRLENKSKISPDEAGKLYYAQIALERLDRQVSYLRRKYNSNMSVFSGWQAFNKSEYEAYQLISKQKALFDEISMLGIAITTIQNRMNEQMQQDVHLDRPVDQPLVP